MSMHQDINGNPATLAVDRAITELRRGRVVHVSATEGNGVLIAAAETTPPARIDQLSLLAGDQFGLAVTAQRATVLGLDTGDGGSKLLRFSIPPKAEAISVLAGISEIAAVRDEVLRTLISEPCDPASSAALLLAKHARLLPAVLTMPAPALNGHSEVMSVSAAQIQAFEHPTLCDLSWISDARVPLAGHEDCRLVLFRDARDGAEHVAIIIGSLDGSGAVPVRMHSACFTGDLLGSLRCDCGDQLRIAVDQLAAAGGGVLLYLAQEGRGIGLANKLRAYELQDTGLDTIDADRHLGFRADERNYAVAASMLRKLAMTRIRLLTNNPQKMRALQDAGIDVVACQPLVGTVNRHNARYIRAKRERAGHLVPDCRLQSSG